MRTNADEQLSTFSLDAAWTRARMFAEGVAKTVSALLLVFAVSNVDLKQKGSGIEQTTISPVAAITMALSILLMALPWPWLSKVVAGVHQWLSNLLVLLCTILVMYLASDGLLVMRMQKNQEELASHLLVFSCACAIGVIVWFVCCQRWGGNEIRGRISLVERCQKDLENTVDFYAAFTALFFLGLERLVLEVEVQQPSKCKGTRCHRLEYPLAVSSVTCVVGVAIMFFLTVPFPARTITIDMRYRIEAFNVVLAGIIAVNVIWISVDTLQILAVCFIVSPAVAFFLFSCLHMHEQQQEDPQAEVPNPLDTHVPLEGEVGDQQIAVVASEFKPPSLELTKLAFAAFLAVSIPGIANCLLSNWAIAFILLTANCVLWALIWRLLGDTTDPSPVRARAATAAFIMTHVSAIASLFPFGVMAAMNMSSWCPDPNATT